MVECINLHFSLSLFFTFTWLLFRMWLNIFDFILYITRFRSYLRFPLFFRLFYLWLCDFLFFLIYRYLFVSLSMFISFFKLHNMSVHVYYRFYFSVSFILFFVFFSLSYLFCFLFICACIFRFQLFIIDFFLRLLYPPFCLFLFLISLSMLISFAFQ